MTTEQTKSTDENPHPGVSGILTNARACANVPTVNLERARRFYEEVLGLKAAIIDERSGVYYRAGNGTMLNLYERPHTASENSAATFLVEIGEGSYQLGEASTVASGATNAVFRFDKKSLTLLTADNAKISNFKFDECGLSRGVPKDVSETGCSNFTSIAVCGQEYDLVKIEENKLQLGARPADGVMCSEEKRPKSLGSPLIKQSN